MRDEAAAFRMRDIIELLVPTKVLYDALTDAKRAIEEDTSLGDVHWTRATLALRDLRATIQRMEREHG